MLLLNLFDFTSLLNPAVLLSICRIRLHTHTHTHARTHAHTRAHIHTHQLT